MNPGILDHVLAPALVISFVLWALLGYRSFLARLESGDAGARRREYREIVLVQWGTTALVLLAWFGQGRTWADLGPGAASPERFLVAWGLAVALVAFLVLQWWTTRENDRGLRQIRDAVGGAAAMIPRTDAEVRWFAGVSLTAGICEEILYRGFLFAWVTVLLGPWAGLALTTLAFGSAHVYQGPSGVVRTAVAGLVFGSLVLVGGSLWPAVLVHVVLDLTSGSLARRALALAPEPVAAPA